MDSMHAGLVSSAADVSPRPGMRSSSSSMKGLQSASSARHTCPGTEVTAACRHTQQLSRAKDISAETKELGP